MYIKITQKANGLLKTSLEKANEINVKKDLPLNNFIKLVKSNDNVVISSLQDGGIVGNFPIVDFPNLDKLFQYKNNFIAQYLEDKINVVTSVDLHGHTGSSLLDGMIKIKDIVKKTVYSRAITDHGVMYSCVDFYKEMKKNHKKPIIGFEAYTEEKYGSVDKRRHLVLIAKNSTGYTNIAMLSTLGHTNLVGRYQKRPTLKHEWIEKYSEGVIALSACVGGEIPQYILNGREDLAEKLAIDFKNLYGEDFYIEIQRHYIDGFKESNMSEEELNQKLIALAKKLNIKIVATTDAHYLEKEYSIVHEIHLCNQTGKKLSDPNRYKFPGTDYHMHTIEEMEEKFKDIPEALFNTLEIMDKVNFEFEFGNYKMPKFPVPSGMTENQYLIQLAWEGFNRRFPVGTVQHTSTEYRERMDFELDVISKMGYEAYFLIVWDFVNYSKQNSYPVGPGRGSACGLR